MNLLHSGVTQYAWKGFRIFLVLGKSAKGPGGSWRGRIRSHYVELALGRADGFRGVARAPQGIDLHGRQPTAPARGEEMPLASYCRYRMPRCYVEEPVKIPGRVSTLCFTAS